MPTLAIFLLGSFSQHCLAEETRFNLRGVTLRYDIPSTTIIQRQKVIQLAKQQIGTPYVFGGSTPQTGFDCSGLVQFVFQNAVNKSLPRTSRAISQKGQTLQRNELQPGDLVFFNTNGKTNSHVGIYLGQQQFIHAPRRGKTVRIAKLDLRYWARHYQGAKRILTP